MKKQYFLKTTLLFIITACFTLILACDDDGKSSKGSSDPIVTGNTAPVANDQNVETDTGVSLNITLTASDADSDPLTWHIDSSPTHGTLSGTAPDLVYEPNAGYFGSDSFTFHVDDGMNDSNTATISIFVSLVLHPTNTPPVANSQFVNTEEDTSVNITLTASDANSDPLTWHIDSSPAHGTLSGTAPDLSYEPNANYSGSDSFTFHVNDSTADSNTATVDISVASVQDIFYVVPGGAGNGDGSSWDNAFTHPQDAVDIASSGDEIWVQSGTYYRRSATDTVLLTMKGEVNIYGGFSGTEAALGERDYADNTTLLDGNDNVYHVVCGTYNARLDGFTITGGNAAGDSYDSQGGGMYNRWCGGLVIANCRFTGNNATNKGGGIYCEFSIVTIENCIFNNNSSSALNGGGMYLNLCATVVISNCLIYNNTASIYGGGIYNYQSTDIEISSCTIYHNSAQVGGGIFNNAVSDSTELVNCIMWNGTAVSAPEIYNSDTDYQAVVTYSDIDGGYPGTGNIDSSPMFETGSRGNFYLRHIACQGGSFNSPCVNAGDNTAVFYGLDTKRTATCINDSGTVDMGYHYEP